VKLKITLFILLTICAKLTALALPVDTNKVRQNDTVKQNYNLKYLTLADFSIRKHSSNNVSIAATPHYHDDYNSAVAVNRQPDYSLTAITYPDSLNITRLVHSSAGLSMADSHLAENVNNKIRIKNADSLRLLAIMLRQDSIRVSIYKQNKDSVRRQLVLMNLDSLKLLLKYPASDLYKGQIYTEIANRYLDYDTISNKMTLASYENKALSYSMLALHQFSSFNDTTGLRVTFDHLTKVYIAQKKFSQAKWFILQSNSLSRAKNDAPNVIASLITLAKIKTEVGDSKLAMGDMDEALQISTTKKNLKLQSEVLRNYAMFYSRLKNYPKEEAMLKKRDSVEDIIRKNEEAKQLAALAAKDSAEKKKADSVQVKKKVFTSNTRKLSKSASSKKAATL
jgi:tetratricopeptide (TPR) repeat protein